MHLILPKRSLVCKYIGMLSCLFPNVNEGTNQINPCEEELNGKRNNSYFSDPV